MVSLPTRGDQLALHRFLGDQPHGPAGPAFGRVAAYHRDNPLLLAGVEHGRRAGALPFIQRSLQSAFLGAVADVANGLRSEWDHAGNPWRADAFG